MIDVLLYAPDVDKVMLELLDKLPEALNSQGTDYAISKTPSRRSGQTSLALVRLTDEEWTKFQNADVTSLEVLAYGDDPIGQVLALDTTSNALKRYRELWPETITAEGETVRLPDRFGSFAGDNKP